MQREFLESSDAVRTAQPLRYAQSVTFERPLTLEQGGHLPQVTVAYETYGQLSAARDNAVLICHALSGDSHVARHEAGDSPGWWEILVGPGKPIDTERYFVVCPNILGGCRGTTGPNSINAETGHPYGSDFPVVSVGDMVEAQKWLLDHLGIERLLAVVGGSLGGHMVLTWATRFSDRVAGAAALATSPRLTSQALAFDVVGRNAILRDPAFDGGQYYDHGSGPAVGLALVRMLGHITYLSQEAMTQKFEAQRQKPHDVRSEFETKFAVGSYLAYQGDKFVERFDANSYLTLTMAMDLFDLGDSPQKLIEKFRDCGNRWLLLSFSSDWLFPPFQSQEIVDALIALHHPVSYCNVQSNCGHDAFLLSNEVDIYGEMVRAFLANLGGCKDAPAGAAPPQSPARGDCSSPTSIFHQRRLDYDSILELIPPGASVLDLGCGTGELLARLGERGHTRIMGVEQDQRAIVECVRRGLDVVQADLNQGLSAFSDRQFDYVVLSQTLQAVMDVEKVLADVLRIGQRGIVSFPNFAYWKLRGQLAQQGRAPRASMLRYHWYDTPNVRFLTIADFEEFCREKGIRIQQRIALDTETDRHVEDNPNLNADIAIMVISQ